jgi:hypothetical protein
LQSFFSSQNAIDFEAIVAFGQSHIISLVSQISHELVYQRFDVYQAFHGGWTFYQLSISSGIIVQAVAGRRYADRRT